MSLNLEFDWFEAPCPKGVLEPKVVDDLPQEGIANGDVFIIRNCESRYLTHDFHKFAGKFIPHVPRWAINRYLKRGGQKVVLDPFVGSGTTLVEAMLDGQRGYGVDIDPLARLIAKVKTTPIAEDRLRSALRHLATKLEDRPKGTYRPNIPTLSHWFTGRAIEELSSIDEIIQDFREEIDLYDFLTIAFSAIVRRVSNADNQTMKTYVSHTYKKKPEFAKPLFLYTVSDYIERMIKFNAMRSVKGTACVVDGCDAREIGRVWVSKELPAVDLVVTSPPYIKSVDYLYNQMAELFWIGQRWNLNTQKLQNEYKRNYVGNDRPNSQKKLHLSGISEIDSIVTQVHRAEPKLAAVAAAYFRDMSAHFRDIRKVLKPGARYILVVGGSTLAGIPIPTHKLLISCALTEGFRTELVFGYEIRNKHMRFPRQGRGGVVSHDWLIELRAK
jgi:DNA methylase